jgi:solute:Na+ symporter, SSS family
VIGALVPAAIMSIAAANLFARNIYREFFARNASPVHETRVSQAVSLIVKAGALVFVLALSKTFSINLQLLGGIWILQTFPSIVPGRDRRDTVRRPRQPGAGAGARAGQGGAVAGTAPGPGAPGQHSTTSVCRLAMTWPPGGRSAACVPAG